MNKNDRHPLRRYHIIRYILLLNYTKVIHLNKGTKLP